MIGCFILIFFCCEACFSRHIDITCCAEKVCCNHVKNNCIPFFVCSSDVHEI